MRQLDAIEEWVYFNILGRRPSSLHRVATELCFEWSAFNKSVRSAKQDGEQRDAHRSSFKKELWLPLQMSLLIFLLSIHLYPETPQTEILGKLRLIKPVMVSVNHELEKFRSPWEMGL